MENAKVFLNFMMDPENAEKITGVPAEKIRQAAEMMAKPKADGTRPKTSVGIEKGFYWSNNTGNTQAISALGIICGCGGRPGQVIGRGGGHQRGGVKGGKYPRNKSPMKLPGRRRRALDTDTYTMAGHTKLAHVIGTTWIQSMCGSQQLGKRFEELTVQNPNQVMSYDKQEIIETLKARADSGGMVVVNQDIYLVDPIGNRYAEGRGVAADMKRYGFLEKVREELTNGRLDRPDQQQPTAVATA